MKLIKKLDWLERKKICLFHRNSISLLKRVHFDEVRYWYNIFDYLDDKGRVTVSMS